MIYHCLTRLSKRLAFMFVVISMCCTLNAYSQELESEEEVYPRELESSSSTLKRRQYSLTTFKVPNSIAVNREPAYKDYNAEELLKEIFVKTGSCTSIENVKIKVMGWDSQSKKWVKAERGLVYFEQSDSDFPMDRGLILSTANALEAEGPNKKQDAMSGYVDRNSDPDLDKLLPGYLDRVNNFTFIEFDFTPTGNKMEFEYIFASEEYPYYVNSQYNDVFGFFISSLDNVNAKTNIATIKNSNTKSDVVSINNVNNGRYGNFNYSGSVSRPISNSDYFIPNPLGGKATELNGYTKVLTAEANVVPCKKYRLKIAIGNMGDAAYGSAVFLKANSFNTSDKIVNVVDGKEDVYNVFTQKKSATKFIVTTSNLSDYDTTIQLEFGGTAINGVDYTGLDGAPLKNSYVVPKGKNRIEIPYILKESALDKYIDALLYCPCIGGSIASSQRIRYVECLKDIDLHATLLCKQGDVGTITVDVEGSSNLYEYSKDGIYWQTSNVFDNLSEGNYTIYVQDKDGCSAISKDIAVELIAAPKLGADRKQCSNPLFELNAPPLKKYEKGKWSFVGASQDTHISDVYSPTASVTVPEGREVVLRWTLSYETCSKQTYSDVKLKNIKDNNKHQDKILTISKREIKGETLTIDLNHIFKENPIQTPNWLPSSVASAINFDSNAGVLTLEKAKLLTRVSSFRYSTDHCGEPLFRTIYINVID